MLQRLFLILSFSIVLSFAGQADSTWKKEATFNANFNQTYFHKWSAGGVDALNTSFQLKGTLERNINKFNWKNNGKLAVGFTKLEDDWQKSLDEIFIESILGFNWTKVINPYLSAALQSQFTRGYEYKTDGDDAIISNFWDPGYLTQGLGLGFKPVSNLLTRFGYSQKETFSAEYGYADDETTEEYEEFKFEPGLESITEYSVKLNDIVKYDTKLNVFVNFKGFEEIDGRWQNTVTAQISKYINVNFEFEWLYDRDIRKDGDDQYREAFAIGFNYNLF